MFRTSKVTRMTQSAREEIKKAKPMLPKDARVIMPEIALNKEFLVTRYFPAIVQDKQTKEYKAVLSRVSVANVEINTKLDYMEIKFTGELNGRLLRVAGFDEPLPATIDGARAADPLKVPVDGDELRTGARRVL